MKSSLAVVVVGAGAVGASIAATLAERGAKVTLIDQGLPGEGTSGATFGWINANGKEPYEYFDINRLGLEAHYRLAGAHKSWLGTSGHVEIAVNAEHAERLKQRVERLSSRQYPTELLSRHRAAKLLPGIRVPSAAELIAHFPRETYAYPSIYIAHALGRARAAGAQVISGVAVTALQSATNGGAVVHLADGTTVNADSVVSAVGRWTAELSALAGVNTPMQLRSGPGDPTVGFLLETSPAPILLDHIVTSPQLNLRPNGAGRLLLQALDLDESADPFDVPVLGAALTDEFLRRLRELAIGGEFAKPERLVVGQRAMPADGHTIAGLRPEASWFYVVATHSGITLAPFLGEAVADEIMGGERSELAMFRPERFAEGSTATEYQGPRLPGEQ